ncbi:type III secretion system export apparatus subunit SctU [Pseudooceanicola aestuarii]|uniref:type III secretion system export apparatus subunit SctU n=1 Tax=Pseudooceanicola aestuarii TaxID=2697319 RepID=UPI0013D50128|nr:type III secretion system export apparatus subunit SctU [Pseudooceanicola aestuarii]
MSQSSGEKTEQPTPKKERDARQKGQVARSQEVVTTISLFGTIAVIMATGDFIWARLVALMDQVAMLAANPGTTTLHTGIAIAWETGVTLMLPVIGVTLFLGIAANYVQVGSLFSFQSIQPKLEKISIGKGFKRIFSMKQVVELLKSIFKILFLSLLLYIVIRDAIGPYVSAINCGLPCLATVTNSMMIKVLAFSALAFVIVAGFDFVYQRHSHTKSLMMSKDEVKREYKESEGDPIVKGQRKQFAQEILMGDAPKQAGKATALVVNPTHFAVSIRYRKDDTPLPMITARGRNAMAHEMRAEAERAGVPIFRNPPLARHLFAETVPGDFVPDELFDVIAEILAWVARHEDGLYAGRLERGDIDMERGDHRPSRAPAS